MKRMLPLALIGASLLPLASGCGLARFLFGTTLSTESGSSKLIPFGSEAELASYLSGEIQRRNSMINEGDRDAVFGDDVALDGAAPPTNGSDGGTGDSAGESADQADGFSGTTLQEEGVDESDVVKTDGNFIYMVGDGREGSVLRIVDVSGPSFTVVSETELTGWGRELYLRDDKVVALTSTGGGFFAVPLPAEPVAVDVLEGDATVDGEAGQGANTENPDAGQTEPDADDADLVAPQQDYQYERPRSVVTVFDVTDRANPVQLSETSFEGSRASSRLIEGVLHIVLANYQSYYYDVFPALGTPELDATIQETGDVLPQFEQVLADGTTDSGPVVTWESIYRPDDPDGFGIVTVVSLDVDDDASFSTVAVAAEPGLVYSSTEALYLTDTSYNFQGRQRETTDIYKFSYVDRGAEATATGTVPGRVLNQYSMGEHDGYLRVATTISGAFSVFGPTREPSNDVYVLDQNDSTLGVSGSVIGLAPGETIQSARFIGERGFVVTFEQIDPFFTLDLSDPTNPIVVGELKVPGFSTFLVPMDENHILAVGQYIPPPGEFGAWGVQLSIYDITDFANPTEMSNVILGEQSGANSEALYDPKAFTYYSRRDMVALPLLVYDQGVFEDEVDVVAAEPPGDDSADSSQLVAEEPPSDDGSSVGDEPIDSDTAEPFVPGGFEGVVVFSATVEDGFTELGRVSTRYPQSGIYYSSYTRGVFLGDDILAVTDKGIRRAPTSDTETVVDQIVFE